MEGVYMTYIWTFASINWLVIPDNVSQASRDPYRPNLAFFSWLIVNSIPCIF